MHKLSPGITLVLGGARSGKSRFAETLIEASGLNPVYMATAGAGDSEMATRIAAHRARRGDRWRTVEAPIELDAILREEDGEASAILVDCLTLWVTNLMMREVDIGAATGLLLGALETMTAPVVLVSNEVGLGIVPDNEMAREFRDHAGNLNQAIAAMADTVYFVAAGLPLVLKQD